MAQDGLSETEQWRPIRIARTLFRSELPGTDLVWQSSHARVGSAACCRAHGYYLAEASGWHTPDTKVLPGGGPVT